MTTATFDKALIRSASTVTRPRPAPKQGWPLMCDIASARGGVPEHLIQWRRDRGEDDPEPQL